MDISKDYYAMLGIDTLASTSMIKAAFKKQALQYHPDVYKGADAQERMRDILQAYQILRDPATRREYDANRCAIRKDGSSNFSTSSGNRRQSGRGAQERFAFPELNVPLASTLSLKLEGTIYQISSDQARHLWREGVLRGTTSKGEYLLLRCIHCRAVFMSQEVRDSLRGNIYYHPYQLFPLCPNCRRSEWCPAENRRVAALRAAAARRSLLLWSSIIGSLVLVLVLVMLFVLHL